MYLNILAESGKLQVDSKIYMEPKMTILRQT